METSPPPVATLSQPAPPEELTLQQRIRATGPIGDSNRVAALDLLRGFALFGIFMVNMQVFAMPFAEYLHPSSLKGGSLSTVLSWAFVKTFFEYKFISLFSLLFGAGLIVQMIRAENSGRRFVPMYLRRLFLLGLFGLTHGLLFWYGDILFVYSCIGFWLLLMRKLRPKTMFIVAGCFIIFFSGLTGAAGLAGLIFADDKSVDVALQESDASTPAAMPVDSAASVSTPPDAGEPKKPDTNTDVPEFAQDIPWLRTMFEVNFDYRNQAWIDAETNAYKNGPLSQAMGFRSITYLFAILAAVAGYGWHVFAMFLIGAALMKLGFFSPLHAGWHRRFVIVGFSIGLPLEMVSTYLSYVGIVNDRWPFIMLSNCAHELGSVSLCLGLVGIGCLLSSSAALERILHPIRCVGRMSLTNYFAQTLLATALMYWWGLGWFGDVPRPMQISLVILIYTAQLLFSTLWMRHFVIGPVEWLWRSLTYLRFPPMVRPTMQPSTEVPT